MTLHFAILVGLQKIELCFAEPIYHQFCGILTVTNTGSIKYKLTTSIELVLFPGTINEIYPNGHGRVLSQSYIPLMIIFTCLYIKVTYYEKTCRRVVANTLESRKNINKEQVTYTGTHTGYRAIWI